jgi:hypothetical protein
LTPAHPKCSMLFSSMSWSPANGPPGAAINCLTASSAIFAGHYRAPLLSRIWNRLMSNERPHQRRRRVKAAHRDQPPQHKQVRDAGGLALGRWVGNARLARPEPETLDEETPRLGLTRLYLPCWSVSYPSHMRCISVANPLYTRYTRVTHPLSRVSRRRLGPGKTVIQSLTLSAFLRAEFRV